MRSISTVLLIIFCILLFGEYTAFSREHYEDYRSDRKRYERRDRPLSEIREEDREDILDDLRGAVREEIDESMSKERKASKKKIDESKLIQDVRQIVREEIEDAIKIKDSAYLKAGTWEVGGFFSFQVKALAGSTADNNTKLKLFPMVSYFLLTNLALGLKGEADLNLTTGTQSYTVGLGPQFIFGIDKADEICFYTTISLGVSIDTSRSSSLGYRFANELGVKFVLTSGVILNTGLMLVFDNGGDSMTGFQNLIIPAIGITAWF
ncbi:MAG: hypothetical protein GY754_16015 [bacterium]|nr:hypothetical protein [bacterium]